MQISTLLTNDLHFCILKMKFMETSNTKDVCIHANNTPVKFRGKISNLIFFAHCNLMGANIKAAILDFQQKIDRVVPIGCDPTGS